MSNRDREQNRDKREDDRQDDEWQDQRTTGAHPMAGTGQRSDRGSSTKPRKKK